jgi:hypothetical protein
MSNNPRHTLQAIADAYGTTPTSINNELIKINSKIIRAYAKNNECNYYRAILDYSSVLGIDPIELYTNVDSDIKKYAKLQIESELD